MDNTDKNEIIFTHQELLLLLHALSVVITEFITTSKTFKECAEEFSICTNNDIKQMLMAGYMQILLNNFCEQIDEVYENTNSDSYVKKDNFHGFDFSKVEILNDKKYSPKQLVKEIRDSIAHQSYTINYDLLSVNLQNKRSGFNATIDRDFLFDGFYINKCVNRINGYVIDDRNVNFDNDFTKEFANFQFFRIRQQKKWPVTFFEYLAPADDNYLFLFEEYLQDDNFTWKNRPLTLPQRELLEMYFSTHEFNRKNFKIATERIFFDSSPHLVQENNFMSTFLLGIGQKIGNHDCNFQELLNDEEFQKMMKYTTFVVDPEKVTSYYELVDNYFKILFMKYYFQNKPLKTEAERHIRNSLIHGRYTRNAESTILFYDHKNGVENETKLSFIAQGDMDAVFKKLEKRCFEEEDSYYFGFPKQSRGR